MSLQDIRDTIERHVKDKPFVLNSSTTGTSAITHLLEQTYGVTEITMKRPRILDEGASVNGKASLLGVDGIDTTVTFQETDQVIGVCTIAKMPPSWKFEIPGMTWFSVEDFVISLRMDSPDAEATGDFSMTVRSGNTRIPISVQLPVDRNGWLVKGNFEKVDLTGGLGDLAGMVGLDSLGTVIPPGFDQAINRLAITDIEIFFSPRNKKVYYISLLVELGDEGGKPGKWDIIADKVSIEKAKLYLKVSHPTDKTRRAITFVVGGTFEVGEERIPIAIQKMAGTSEWSMQVASPEGIQLPGISDFSKLIGGDGLAKDLPSGLDVLDNILLYAFGLGLDIKTKSITTLDLTVGRSTPWPLPEVEDVSLENMLMNLHNAKLPGEAGRTTTGSISGTFKIGGVGVTLTGEFGTEFTLRGAIPRVNLSNLAEDLLKDISLPPDLPDFAFSDVAVSITPKTGAFSLSGKSATPWEIPIGIDGLSIGNVSLAIKRTVAADRQKKVTGTIGGTLKIGSASFDVAYNFPGDFVLGAKIPSFSLSPLVQELCGGDVVRDLPVPVSVLAVELSDIAVSIAPQRRSCSFAANSGFGQTEIVVKQVASGGWGFSVGFIPPAGWKFSDIADELNVLDGLRFSKTVMILASSDDPSFALTKVRLPSAIAISRGLNFCADLDLSGLGVDELTGLNSLSVYAAIGTRPADLVLEAAIAGRIQIAENVAMGDVKFRLKPAPSDFSLTLLGTVAAQLDQSALLFVGGLQIKPRSATLQATMKGTWNEPFGTKGVAIADVALDLGLSYPPLAPVIGIAGALQVGDFKGAAAVRFDSAMPSKSMLAVAFNRLYLMDIVKAFCDPQIVNVIPQALTTTVLDFGFEDVKVYIVPQPTQIGQLKFKQGFTVQGTVQFAGLRAYAYANIDYVKGILVKGEVDVIDLAGIFKLAGAGEDPKASLYIDLRVGQSPSVDITGALTLLGLTREAKISISDSGFYFMISGKIFDLFECTLEASGGALSNGDVFFIRASMKNDLFAYLQREASNAIQAAADEATGKISDAQQAVRNAQAEVNHLNNQISAMRQRIQTERDRDAQRLRQAQQAVQSAQAEVNRLNNQITAMRQTIQRERDRDAQRLRDAQQAVQSAQAKVNRLNNEINAMRQTIQRERDRDSKRLQDAQKAVADAQTQVNRLQGEINRTKGRINQLNREIAGWKRWYDNLPWYKKMYEWGRLSYEVSWRGTEIGALYTKIGGIETAKHAAIGVLEVAKQTLRGLEQAAKTFPIDADPRMVGLFTARETANAALEVAKQTLRGLEQATKTFPIDADPRMVGLFTARGTANAALEVAKQTLRGLEQAVKTFPIDADPRMIGLFTARETVNASLEAANLFLEGVKASVGALADVGEYIVKYGLGGLLDIRSASFEASLNSAAGGMVSLQTELVFMKEVHKFTFPFNFNNPLASARDLARRLLPA